MHRFFLQDSIDICFYFLSSDGYRSEIVGIKLIGYRLIGISNLLAIEQQDWHKNQISNTRFLLSSSIKDNLRATHAIVLQNVTPLLLIEPSPRQAAGNVHRKDENRFPVRSLTPPQAAGKARAVEVQASLSIFMAVPLFVLSVSN